MVDVCFGLLNKCYRSSDCDTVKQLGAIVEAPATCNSTQLFDWEWQGEWDKFLLLKFNPLPGIRKIQHFCFSREAPGIAFTRTSVDTAENQLRLLKPGIDPNNFNKHHLPQLMRPEGLSPEGAQYLHKEVRPFVYPEYRDILCPVPKQK